MPCRFERGILWAYPLALAELKAQRLTRRHPGALVIGALVYAVGLTLAAPEGRGDMAVGVLVGV